MLTEEIENFILSNTVEKVTNLFREYGYEKTKAICTEIGSMPNDANSKVNTPEGTAKVRAAANTIVYEHRQAGLLNDLEKRCNERISSSEKKYIDTLSSLDNKLDTIKVRVDKLHKDEKTGIAETINRCVVSVAMLSGFLFILYLLYVLIDLFRNRVRRNSLIES